jgi:hypothetical protein
MLVLDDESKLLLEDESDEDDGAINTIPSNSPPNNDVTIDT